MLTYSLGLSLGSAALHGGWHALVKLSSQSLKSICFGQFFGGLICLSLAFIIEPFYMTYKLFSVIVLSGFVHAIYLFFLAVAYKDGELSISIPISRSFSILVLYALSASFKDLFTVKFLGFFFIIFGIIFMNCEKKTRFLKKDVIFAILIGTMTIFYSFIDKEGIQLMRCFAFSSASTALTGVFLSFFLMIINMTLKSQKSMLTKQNVFFGIFIGISGLSIYSSFLILLQHMPLPFAMANRQFSIIISSLLGYIFFKEKFGKIKILSLLLLIFGLIFLNISTLSAPVIK